MYLDYFIDPHMSNVIYRFTNCLLSVISTEIVMKVNAQICNQNEKYTLHRFLHCKSLFKFDNPFEGSYNFKLH